MKTKPCFGIVSYFPWEQPGRKQRQDRLDRLVKQLSELWPDVPIIIIAQQWKFYNLEGKCRNKVFRHDFGRLGIMGARNKLREKFLESEFDYLIMFDDDAIIEYDNADLPRKYMETLDANPNGFCFIKGKGSSPYTEYNDSQLNLNAVSRYLYEKEPLPAVDPQKSEGFEDRIWSTLLHCKYSDLEFDAPEGIRCVHFKNPEINKLGGEVPSTWSNEQRYNWSYMRTRTKKIEEYVYNNKKLPTNLKHFYSKAFFDNESAIVDFNSKYHFMQLWGDCSGLGYLGDLRTKGPVDNVYSVLPENIKLLLDNKYYDHIVNTIPEESPRRPSFAGDVGRTYDYKTVKIIHNHATTEEYRQQLKSRIETFNNFYNELKVKDNYYFTVNFNDALVNPQTNVFRDEKLLAEIVDILKKYNILDKTIFVGLKQKNRKDTSNMYVKDKSFIIKYRLKYVEIEDNDVWDTAETHMQFINKVRGML